MRVSRVTGPSSSGVPWCNTPPDSTLPRPYFSLRRSTDRSSSPSRKTERSASGTNIVFEATHPRPTRSRAYASPASLPRPSPGSLPARAGSPLAGRDPHPLNDERNFMESSHSSNPNRPAEPGRTVLPIPTRWVVRDCFGRHFLRRILGRLSKQAVFFLTWIGSS